MNPRIPVLLLLPLLLTACPSLPGPVAQLQRFEAADAQQRYASIAGEAVNADCQTGGGGSDACPALLAVHGRACLELARAESAPGAACPGPTATAKKSLDCAIQDLGSAEATGKLQTGALTGVRQNRAQALYCRATFLAPADGGPLATQAESELSQVPQSATSAVLAARTALYFAARPGFAAAQRCAGVTRARAAAQAGLALQPDAATADALHRSLADSDGWAQQIPCGTGG